MYFKIVDNRKLVLSAPLNTDQEIIESFIKKYLSKFANYIEKASKKILFSFEEKWTYILGEKMNLSYIGGFNTNHAKISGKKLWLLTKTESTTDYLNALKSYLKITLDEYLAKTQKIYEDKMQIPHHQWRITEKTHSWGTNNVFKKKNFLQLEVSLS